MANNNGIASASFNVAWDTLVAAYKATTQREGPPPDGAIKWLTKAIELNLGAPLLGVDLVEDKPGLWLICYRCDWHGHSSQAGWCDYHSEFMCPICGGGDKVKTVPQAQIDMANVMGWVEAGEVWPPRSDCTHRGPHFNVEGNPDG